MWRMSNFKDRGQVDLIDMIAAQIRMWRMPNFYYCL